MSTDLLGLLDLVDESLLSHNEEKRDSVNRARLIQGDDKLELDDHNNKTVRYKGGIGFSLENAPDEILNAPDGVNMKLDNSGVWRTFEEVEIVVLTSARVRRLYMEVDGQNQLACGTNSDGANAKGWRGLVCKAQCEYHPSQVDPKDSEAIKCTAQVPVLIYVPRFKHVAVFTAAGLSYMPATKMLEQVADLSRQFVKREAFKPALEKNPNLKMVNSYFFKTTIQAGKHQADKNGAQGLDYSEVKPPYSEETWAQVTNSGEVIQACRDLLKQGEDTWSQLYSGHNANALMSPEKRLGTGAPNQLTGAGADPNVALPAGATRQIAGGVEQQVKVDVLPPDDELPSPNVTNVAMAGQTSGEPVATGRRSVF